MHLLTDAGAILAAVVTDDRAGDAPVLSGLPGRIVTSGLPPPGQPCPSMLAGGIAPPAGLAAANTGTTNPGCQLLADGAYSSRRNVALCDRPGIGPLIRMSHNRTARGTGSGDA